MRGFNKLTTIKYNVESCGYFLKPSISDMNNHLPTRTPGYLTEDEEGEHGPLSRRFAKGESLLPPPAIVREDFPDPSDTIRMDRAEVERALKNALQE